jgi:hypothetical protein
MKRVALIFLLLTTAAHAGNDFTQISKSISYIQLDKIEEQRKEALKASQHGLSKERIAKLEAQAKAVLEGGAMVMFSSQEIE